MGASKKSFTILLPEFSKIFKLVIYFDNQYNFEFFQRIIKKDILIFYQLSSS